MQLTRNVFFLFATFVLASTAFASQQKPSELESYNRFMTNVLERIKQRDAAFFNDSVDLNLILNDLITKGDFSKNDGRDIKAGFIKGYSRFGDIFISKLPETFTPKLISMVKKGNRYYATVRMFAGEEGMAYYNFHLTKTKKGIQIVDWRDYSSGLLLSDALSQVIIMMAPSSSVLERIYDGISGTAKERNKLMEAISAAVKKDYRQYIKHYKKLNLSTRKNKIFCVIAVQLAMESDDDETYMWSMENLERFHGNDPSVSMLLIDYYYMKNEFAKVDEKMVQLQQKVGDKDSAIWWFRSEIAKTLGNLSKALDFAKRGIKAEPLYEETYWTLLDCYIVLKEYKNAAEMANKIENMFNVEIDDNSLMTVEGYSAAIRSSAWKAARRSR